jgi:hypothetical protein
VEPCVFGGFLFADLFEAGVGDGLLTAAVVALVPVVPDCSHDARNAMPIRRLWLSYIRWLLGMGAPGLCDLAKQNWVPAGVVLR